MDYTKEQKNLVRAHFSKFNFDLNASVYELRSKLNPLSYAQIGSKFKISKQRAQRIYERWVNVIIPLLKGGETN